jgi:hypothetical protein
MFAVIRILVTIALVVLVIVLLRNIMRGGGGGGGGPPPPDVPTGPKQGARREPAYRD